MQNIRYIAISRKRLNVQRESLLDAVKVRICLIYAVVGAATEFASAASSETISANCLHYS